MFNITEHAHRRLNILTGEWILVSPHRSKRPWLGKLESPKQIENTNYEEDCYLCPTNARADGTINPDYKGPFAFDNDFSALLSTTPQGDYNLEGLLVAQSELGKCKVICFSPDHSKTLPELSTEEIIGIIKMWQHEFEKLSKLDYVQYIQIFENKGEVMGCSNPHPHCQIWASSSIPIEVKKEIQQMQSYFIKNQKSLLSDYLKIELSRSERVILENDHFVVLVPFWAVWPFETIVISKRHVQNMLQFDDSELSSLAHIIRGLTIKYDNLFQTSFPYSAGIHQVINADDEPGFHWHMHFYPPLLRSSSIKKFMVGYEMLASPQRDISAEFAAVQIRAASDTHYKVSFEVQNE